jgi:hypothetical protein
MMAFRLRGSRVVVAAVDGLDGHMESTSFWLPYTSSNLNNENILLEMT